MIIYSTYLYKTHRCSVGVDNQEQYSISNTKSSQKYFFHSTNTLPKKNLIPRLHKRHTWRFLASTPPARGDQSRRIKDLKNPWSAKALAFSNCQILQPENWRAVKRHTSEGENQNQKAIRPIRRWRERFYDSRGFFISFKLARLRWYIMQPAYMNYS